MFIRSSTYDKLLDDSMQYHLNQQADMVRLERRLDQAYRFARLCCDEIFRHTGAHQYHEQLEKLVRDK